MVNWSYKWGYSGLTVTGHSFCPIFAKICTPCTFMRLWMIMDFLLTSTRRPKTRWRVPSAVPNQDLWRLPLLCQYLFQRRQMEISLEDTKEISNLIDSLCSSWFSVMIYRVKWTYVLPCIHQLFFWLKPYRKPWSAFARLLYTVAGMQPTKCRYIYKCVKWILSLYLTMWTIICVR